MLKRRSPQTAVICTLLLAGFAPAAAQSLQQNSVQFSGTVLAVSSDYIIPGGEVQYRRTSGRLSLGAGVQVFYDPTTYCESVGKCEKIGATIVAFAEPRIVVGAFANDRAAAYVAGRIAYSKSPASDQGGYVFGGGGGVLVALTEKLSLDLGVQAYTAGSGTGSVFQFRGGFALGF